jgi:preprotein translocase subunit SecG
MKKLLSTKYSAGAFNAAMLLLRLGAGILMMNHGYDKLIHFGSKQSSFMNFLGMGSTVSLSMVIFAEFFCFCFLQLVVYSFGLSGRLRWEPRIEPFGRKKTCVTSQSPENYLIAG